MSIFNKNKDSKLNHDMTTPSLSKSTINTSLTFNNCIGIYDPININSFSVPFFQKIIKDNKKVSTETSEESSKHISIEVDTLSSPPNRKGKEKEINTTNNFRNITQPKNITLITDFSTLPNDLFKLKQRELIDLRCCCYQLYNNCHMGFYCESNIHLCISS